MGSKKYIKYGPEILSIAVRAAAEGASDVELIKVIGCCEKTFYRWLNTRPEFAEAIKEARLPSTQSEDLAKLEERKKWIQSWIDDTLKNQGTITETTTSRTDTSGTDTSGTADSGITTTIKVRNSKPDLRLIQYVLGTEQAPAKPFEVRVTISDPDPDPDQAEYEAMMEAELGESKRASID